ncbi:MAG: hypothetical protein L7S72_12185 [Flavobacteriales bacterium]|nr:hypothetical protein [Flavobacteriales bacterium]
MKTKEVNTNLIGKKVEIIVTERLRNVKKSLMIEGIVTGIFEDKYTKGIEVKHKPVIWGLVDSDVFTKSTLMARKFDESGNLQLAKLIKQI